MRFLDRLILQALLACSLFVSLAVAQTVPGSIVGQVVDSSHLPIAGAKVILVSEQTGDTRTLTAGSDGGFLFLSVLPGPYSLKAEAQGFKGLEVKNLHLTPDERLSAGTLILEVGALAQAVTVKEEGSPVEVESNERSAVMTADQMSMLLTRGRDMITLLSNTIPGAVGFDDTGGSDGWPTPNINGVRNETNAILVDGQTSNDQANPRFWGMSVNLDAIGEVKVLLNNYRAEYGRNGGAMILAITKNGTSQFHGSAYTYQRNESLNANSFFNNQNGISRPIWRVGKYGGTIGGPIYWPGKFNSTRTRLFFFLSTERDNARTPVGLSQWTMPTALERKGDFSQTVDLNNKPVSVLDPLNNRAPFPNSIIPPNRINPSGQALLNVFPLPNFFNRSISLGNYNYNFLDSGPNISQQEIFRIDYNITNKLRIYFRGIMNDARSESYSAGGMFQSWPLARVALVSSTPGGQFSGSYTLSPTVVIEFTGGIAGVNRNHIEPAGGTNFEKELNRSTLGINLPQIYPQNNPLNVLPSTSFGGVTGAANISPRGDFPGRYWAPRAPLDVSATKVAGSHTLKAGIYHENFRYYRVSIANFNGTFNFSQNANNPYDAGWAYANPLLGTFYSYTESDSKPTYYLKGQEFDWYVQDTWKATRRLTIDYGLRATWYSPLAQGDGKAADFLPQLYNPSQQVLLFQPILVTGKRVAVNPLNGDIWPTAYIGGIVPGSGNPHNGVLKQTDPSAPTGFWNNRGEQWGPRLGFAYALTADGKTAFRAGIGMIYQTQNFAQQYFPLVDNTQTVPTIFNGTFDTFDPKAGVLFPTSISGQDLNLKTPTVYNYSAGIQREIGFATLLDVAYVGNLGRQVYETQAADTVPYGSRFLPQNHDSTNNSILPDNFFRPYLGYSSVGLLRTASSSYHSLQVQANRRFARGLQFGASWVWSKAMGYGSQTGSTYSVYPTYLSNDLNYGRTNIDRRHAVKLNSLYDLPSLGRRMNFKPAEWVLDAWQISGLAVFQSGQPLTVTYVYSNGLDVAGGGDWSRPVLTGKAALPITDKTFSRVFDTSVVAPPTSASPWGNAPVDPFNGGGINSWDTAIFKNFREFRERVNFQLRWEAYNVFNNPSFLNVDTAARFSPAGAQINTRLGQYISSRQPRQMQVALRLSF
jgi:hypothetical protein